MTKSRKHEKSDVLIIGGGPAGLSTFLWCRELGLSTVLVEKNAEFGGQLLWIHNQINNYLGRTAENGREMLDHFISQIYGLDKFAIVGNSVVGFDPETVTATLSNGDTIPARTAVIATGVRRRQLGVPGEREFAGRGILESGARDKELVGGKRVIIVGGGDAALENALILADLAEKVYVVHRRPGFSARPEFVRRATQNPKVEFVLDSTVNEFRGHDRLSTVSVSVKSSDTIIDVDAALIRIGVQPNSELVAGKAERDPLGYIIVDHSTRTSLPNVFAVGDIAAPNSPTVSSSVGTGATAAKEIFLQLTLQV
jgi:thioredoxin reductase (NADPH)